MEIPFIKLILNLKNDKVNNIEYRHIYYKLFYKSDKNLLTIMILISFLLFAAWIRQNLITSR